MKMKRSNGITAITVRWLVPLIFLTWVLAPGGNNAVLASAPQTQHIWLHYDYMIAPNGRGDAPNPQSIQLVVDAFAAHGIDLHIDPQHAAIPEHKVLIPDFAPSKGYDCGPANDSDTVSFLRLKAQYFHPTANHEWHYVIFGYYAGPCGPTGYAELPGNNFIVGLGLLRDLGVPITPYTEGGTFMHELGHNLGLFHSGDNTGSNYDNNYMPNRLSVMNYEFQYGIPYGAAPGSTSIIGRRLDYSEELLPTLDEAHLDERRGLGATLPANITDITLFQGPKIFTVAPANGLVDWNQNGVATDADVAVNLNINWDCVSFYNNCDRLEQMPGFDDWAWVHGYLDGTLHPGPKTFVHDSADEPLVTGISPAEGPATGGTVVTISGVHLGKVSEVLFGSAGPADFTIVDEKTITAVAPPASPAGYETDITVFSGTNPSAGIDADVFTYTTILPVITGVRPASGPAGSSITVTGSNFMGTDRVSFTPSNSSYGNDAAGFTVIDDHTLIVKTPTEIQGGAYHILIRNPYGYNINSLSQADVFTFTLPPPPAITSLSPTSGPVTGGTIVTITGSSFATATQITVGGNLVPLINVLNDQTITFVTSSREAAGPGSFDVVVTNPYGTSTTSPADVFTYQ
jgi:hypothetical protein